MGLQGLGVEPTQKDVILFNKRAAIDYLRKTADKSMVLMEEDGMDKWRGG